MSRYSFIWKLQNGRIPVGEGSWTLEVNKEFQTDRDSLTLPLETKQFAGLRATTRAGTIERLFESQATGLTATATAGTLTPVVISFDFLDTFTGTNGDALSGHTPDIYAIGGYWTTTWDPTAGGDPQIQTNRLRGIAASEYIAHTSEAYPSVEPWWITAVLYRRNTTGSTDQVNGIAFCATSSGLSSGAEAFVFGWNELNDQWELWRLWGGFWQVIATDTTNAFTGSAQYRTIDVKVTGTGGFGVDLNIECRVDGTTSITYNETVFSLDLYPYGIAFGGDTSVDIEEISAYSLAPKLTGHRLNTAQGVLTPGNIQLTGLSATASAGLLGVGGGGGAVTQALTGLSCTASQGTGMRGWQSVGSDGVKFDLLPNLKIAWNFNTAFYPGKVRSHFVYKDGSLWGAGTTGDPNNNTYDERLGLYEISESAETTLPWVDTGTGLSSPNDLSVYSTYDGNQFPRSGISPSYTWRYTYALLKGALVAISRDGAIFTSFSRSYSPAGGGDSHDLFIAPQFGEIEPTNNYNGPEFRIARMPIVSIPRKRYQRDLMGVYPITDAEVVAFYPREYDASKSGVVVELCGLRAQTAYDPMTRSASGEAGGVLLGYAATTAQGTLTPSVDGDTQVRLTGLRAETLTYRQFLPEYHNVIPEKSDVNIVPAFRKLKDGVWSDEVVASTFTGHTRSWVIEDSLVTAHSGYGDVLHCVYASARPNATGLSGDQAYDVTHLGVLTIDASTRTVISNTLVSIGAITPLYSPYLSGFINQGVKSNGPERAVAKVVRLDNGTHVTQFLIRGFIAHLQWTDASPTVPTLTIKDKTGLTTTDLGAGWESLESRAGRVYHVLYKLATGGSYNATAQYNDATDPANSTWTTATVTTTGSTNTAGSLSGNTQYDTYIGQGKDKTWLYATRCNAGLGNTIEENQTIWVDFWKNQLPLFSVAAQGVVGRVSIVINPNVALVGHRLTTGTDNVGLFPLVDGSGVGRLTGKRATLRSPSGYDLPIYAQFFVDNFSGSGYLTAHTSDTGHSWNELGAEDFILDTTGSVYCLGTTWDSFVYAYPTLTPPSNDYAVKGRFSASRIQTITISNCINEGIGARISSGNGYWFGFNNADDKWYLMKYHPSEGVILAEYAAAWSSEEFAIEVTGNKPAKIRCFLGGVQVISYDDSSAPYFYSGAPGICSVLGNVNYSYIDYINAGTHDGTLLILQGHQALTSQGVLIVAGGLTGLRANTARGVITPQVSYLTLTGLRADTYQGALTPGNIELLGLAATTAAGTIIGSEVSPAIVALTGMRAYTYGGILELLNRELTGLRADARIGVFTWLSESFQALVGHSATTAPGVLTPADTITITGYAAATAVGVVSPAVSAPYYSTGLAAATRAGILTPSVANVQPLTGLAALTAAGTLTPSTGVETTLTGRSATAGFGTLVPEVTVRLTGLRATARAGVIVPLIVVTPTGQRAVTAAGTMQVLLNIALTGHAATVDYGTFGHRIDGFVTLVGVQAIGRVADLSQGMPPPESDEALFATKQVDSLFFTDDSDDGAVRVLN